MAADILNLAIVAVGTYFVWSTGLLDQAGQAIVQATTPKQSTGFGYGINKQCEQLYAQGKSSQQCVKQLQSLPCWQHISAQCRQQLQSNPNVCPQECYQQLKKTSCWGFAKHHKRRVIIEPVVYPVPVVKPKRIRLTGIV